MAEKVCKGCGTIFYIRTKQAYCDKCLHPKCLHCGNQFRAQNTQFTESGLTIFCSMDCHRQSRWDGNRTETRTCERCESVFTVYRCDPRRYCGRTCAARTNWQTNRETMMLAFRESPYHQSPKPQQLSAARILRKFGPATREKIRQARLKQRFPKRMTSIEQKLHDAFIARGILFEMHRTMFGRWQPDFVIDGARIIIQADGDYWHSLPKARENDARFNAVASQNGWTVFRFSETTIDQDLPSCIDAIVHRVKKGEPGLPLIVCG